MEKLTAEQQEKLNKIKNDLNDYIKSIEEKALLTNDLKEIKSEQKPKNTMRI